jgi:hypothetical protein
MWAWSHPTENPTFRLSWHDFSGVRDIIGSGQAHRFTFKAVIGTDYGEDKTASKNDIGGRVDMHDVGTGMAAIIGCAVDRKAIAFPSGLPTDDARMADGGRRQNGL